MIYPLLPNRVRRAYTCRGILDDYSVPAPSNLPEDWIASVVTAFNPGYEPIENEGLSVTEDGRFLKDIIEKDPEGMLGQEVYRRYGATMSILVKLLDAGERLVLQCHPTDAFAKSAFSSVFGKTECWYIVDAAPNAAVHLGFRPGVTREDWVEAYEKQDVNKMLSMVHRFPVKAGDVIFVHGGMPHAIGEGCFMVELQQPTDLMVIPERVTPGGRILADAKIHGGLGFERMFDCYEYIGYTEEELASLSLRRASRAPDSISYVVGNDLTDKFSMVELNVATSLSYDLAGRYGVALVLDGEGTLENDGQAYAFRRGSKFFLPASAEKVTWNAGKDVRIVICRP
ncbi:MAG: class I mannose-6-phosphate isomerase [Clostridia bacterium]|nr:class I mannose-6-phosphate isomerase [Clostridia bacterium]